jgi:adenine phosphoribosyltransferase
MNLKSFIRDIPNFPKEEIVFKDITPLLSDYEAFHEVINLMEKSARKHHVTKVCGIESRGFIFGSTLAQKMKIGFIPIRKPGKLPAETFSESYDLEYGTDTLEIHKDSLEAKDRVVLIDDLLATGGTAEAAVKLIHKTGADVKLASFLIELEFLEGRNRLNNLDIKSILRY